MSGGFKDIGLVLADRPGALARFGEVLGAAGVGLEGGGVFTHAGRAVAHFLVDDAERAKAELEAAGMGPVTVNEVVTLRLDHEVPGQLGAFARTVAEAGVNVLVQYSDHDHRLVLVVEDRREECLRIAERWDADRRRRVP